MNWEIDTIRGLKIYIEMLKYKTPAQLFEVYAIKKMGLSSPKLQTNIVKRIRQQCNDVTNKYFLFNLALVTLLLHLRKILFKAQSLFEC